MNARQDFATDAGLARIAALMATQHLAAGDDDESMGDDEMTDEEPIGEADAFEEEPVEADASQAAPPAPEPASPGVMIGRSSGTHGR